MSDIRIETIRNGIAEELNKIETSGLEKVNFKLYTELKQACTSLDESISLYELKVGNIKWDDLINEWARIGALFDFYMDTTGFKAVLDNQIFEVKQNLERVASELNSDNYELTEKKFQATKDLYANILNAGFNTLEIKELTNRFNYQVLKYKIADFILDDNNDFNIYILFILNDIERILNSNEVSSNIKDNLRIYKVDNSLIRDNFVKVMRLIVLAETKKQVSDRELDKYINSVIYKESDIKKEYHEPSKEIQGKAQTVPNDLRKIFEYFKEDAKGMVPAAILNQIRISGSITHRSVCVETLINNNFKDVRYLFDALLANKQTKWAIELKKIFAENGIDVSYELDCVFIAYKDTLSSEDLTNYIIKTNNKYFINYIIKNKIDVFDEKFINYIVTSNNPTLMTYLEENILNIPVEIVLDSILNNELKKKSIKNAITKNTSDKERLLDIFNLFGKITDEDLINYINAIIIGLQDIEILLECIRRQNGYFGDNIIRILEQMPESEFKKELVEVLYDNENSWGKFLIDNNEERKWHQIDNKTLLINKYWIEELNCFEASFVSSKLTQEYHLIDFVRNHYQSRLNWQHLYVLSKKLSDKEQEEFNKYFYLGDKKLFFDTVKSIKHDFALNMILEYPESVVDFLKYLFSKEIINLPSTTLDIFVNYYEKKINQENIDLNDRVHNTLSKFVAYYEDAKDMVELLAYIMAKGLINNEILMYAKTVSFASNLNPLFIKAVINAKEPYLRASYASKLYSLNASEWNIIFLTDREKTELLSSEENNDAKDLKLRKYYGDLLKLLSVTPINIKNRIAIEIAKSSIEEYINYIVTRYHELIDILLENIEDNNLYKSIMEISLNSGLDSGGRK